ncbi:MAG: metalloregulator ArsR/SmtB family transcription factor [Finegoldia sp.]|nr:metalloregulator ArsR/SmtB family transcription factor [Finegoldia sp.]
MSLDTTLNALSDKTRREILNMLKDSPKSAGELGDYFDMAPATLSYHLSKLLEADLISVKKDKNYRIYSLNTSIFEDLISFLMKFKED